MKRALILLTALLMLAGTGWAQEGAIDAGLLGPVRQVPATGAVAGIVVLVSDGAGWDDVAQAAAQGLAAGGIAVIGVDLATARKRMRASGDDCLDLQMMIQDVSHQVQRKLDLGAYLLPWLGGLGEGGTLVLAIAGQASPSTLAGVVAIDPPLPATAERPLCPGSGVSGLPGMVLVTPGGDRAAVGTGVRSLTTVPVVPSSASPATALANGLRTLMNKAATENAVEALPLTELPVAGPAEMMAVVYSGDGGWRDLDKAIAENLQAHGVPAVGLDMLRYYWSRRSPTDSAADLSRIIRLYREKWGAGRVVLIGYSFGADVMPVLYNLLPAEDRGAVIQLSLLGFSDTANFEVSMGEWLGHRDEDTIPTLPEAARIPPVKLQCLQGREDQDAACGRLKGVETLVTDGDHHFDGDYDRLAAFILAGAKRRAVTPRGDRGTAAPPNCGNIC